MEIVVAPISGGYFPNQLGVFCSLCDIDFRPDVILSTSGGNVAAYITLAANYTSKGIYRVSSALSSDMFVKEWTNFLPSWGTGLYTGSLYKPSDEIVKYFDNIFTPKSISLTEIWTGTSNCTQNKAALYCNLTEKKSLLKPCVDKCIFSSLPPTYLDGDIKKISRTCLASASIPIFIAGQKIDGDIHSDGGLYYSSPLIPLQESIPSSAHLIYISSSNIEEGKENKMGRGNLFGNITSAFSQMVNGLLVMDRHAAIRHVSGNGKMSSVIRKEGKITSQEDLKVVMEERRKYSSSYVEFFPEENNTLNISSFNYHDIHAIIDKTRNNFLYRLYTKK